MASIAKAKALDAPVRANPLDILGKEGCKVQSLTVSDQHATLLLSHPFIMQDHTAGNDDEDGDDGDQPSSFSTSKTISSLLKLTLVPFHKALLGSNPVITPEDIKRGQFPERNLLEHNPNASEEIISFLSNYNFAMKSESGAEYSYYVATPNPGICALVGGDGKRERSTNNAASDFGAFDIELVSPASAYQLSRAMPSLGHILIHESPEMYNTVVKPYIQTIIDSGSLSWIKNVVELKKEKERLLVNHDDFVINVDTKWRSHPPPLTTPREEWYNHPSTVDLYCLGIVKDHDITCIRELRKDHVNMLKEIEKEGLNAIKTVYGIEKDQIRVFIHYQPQFYHFHVHFTRLDNEVGCIVERSHLLNDVIQNLCENPEYYLKRIITYKLKKGTPLHNFIENNSNEAEGNAK